jgi:phospholipase C
VQAGNYPSVSLIKMAAFQDAHPGNSDPLDEQTGVVNLINFLQQQPDWKDTAVIITYDDSDGWYDHSFAQPTRSSFSSADALNGPGVCGTGTQPDGVKGSPVNGRCGPGTRIPFMVISPFARQNFVSHTLITQASVTRFIEDNWLRGQRLGGGSFDATSGSIMDMFNFNQLVLNFDERKLVLDPTMGTVVSSAPRF